MIYYVTVSEGQESSVTAASDYGLTRLQSRCRPGRTSTWRLERRALASSLGCPQSLFPGTGDPLRWRLSSGPGGHPQFPPLSLSISCPDMTGSAKWRVSVSALLRLSLTKINKIRSTTSFATSCWWGVTGSTHTHMETQGSPRDRGHQGHLRMCLSCSSSTVSFMIFSKHLLANKSRSPCQRPFWIACLSSSPARSFSSPSPSPLFSQLQPGPLFYLYLLLPASSRKKISFLYLSILK